ncbi:MAG: hypothetical protein VXY00_03760 [Candidatus Latescibacterota bacterium]|nr:hypothetical protein [Candidatus Latescibacterota bacterium]
MNALIVAFLAFALNLLSGYWHAGLRKRSLLRFLAIHLPVPAISGLRFFADIDWNFMSSSVACFFTGQWVGARR